MNEVFDELQRSLAEGRPVVLATVAATRGSTPRRAGALPSGSGVKLEPSEPTTQIPSALTRSRSRLSGENWREWGNSIDTVL